MKIKSDSNNYQQHFGMAVKTVKIGKRRPLLTYVYGLTDFNKTSIPDSKYLIFAPNSHTTAAEGSYAKIKSKNIFLGARAVLKNICLSAENIVTGKNVKIDGTFANKKIVIGKNSETGYNLANKKITVNEGAKTLDNNAMSGTVEINRGITGNNYGGKIVINDGTTKDNRAEKIIINGKSTTGENLSEVLKVSKDSSVGESSTYKKPKMEYDEDYEGIDSDFIPVNFVPPIINF